jgi:alpha-glucosidase (family GH31 glycosyl hydrolase)
VGNDLCGFADNTTPELCARWLSMGAWTPFSRNHNNNESIPQEPFAFQETYVVNSFRSAYKERYSMLKWMYSLFVRSYENDIGFGTGTVMRPMWWHFPGDERAFELEDVQFMLGEEYLIAPVLN